MGEPSTLPLPPPSELEQLRLELQTAQRELLEAEKVAKAAYDAMGEMAGKLESYKRVISAAVDGLAEMRSWWTATSLLLKASAVKAELEQVIQEGK